MGRVLDLRGQRFGRWTVVRRVANQGTNALLILRRQLDPVTLRRHLQRSAPELAEVAVGVSDGSNQCRLEHLLEPLLAHSAISKHYLECRIQRLQVEQRLDDIEDQDAHRALKQIAGSKCTIRASLRFVR